MTECGPSSTTQNGWIYILTNPAMPGYVKIGQTKRDVHQRVRELSTATGVPVAFTLYGKYAVEDPAGLERRIHRTLRQKRVNVKREFFALSPDEAAIHVEIVIARQGHRKPVWGMTQNWFGGGSPNAGPRKRARPRRRKSLANAGNQAVRTASREFVRFVLRGVLGTFRR